MENPVWTEPYYDVVLEEEIISVSYPIYFEENSSGSRSILGVASIDLAMKYLEEYGITK